MKYSIGLKKGLLALTVILVISFVFLSGCLGSSSTGDQGTSTNNVPATYTGSSGEKSVPLVAPVPAPAGYDSTSQSSTPTYTDTTTSGDVYTNISDRKVIMTASVQMETPDNDKTVNSIRSITSGAGGYVESSSTYTTTGDKKHTTITLKVPQTAFESSLAQIKALGDVKSESSSGQDITRQYIDLSARLKNMQDEEKTLGDIMGMSKNVTEVLAVEQQLYRVRGDIESTQAQLNYLGSQVDFSTITVQVDEPQPVVGYDWGLDTAFRDAAHAFTGMIGALIVLTGYLIPLILYFAIGLAVLYVVVRLALRLYKNYKKK